MKLKTLVGSMALLGIVSTGAFAANTADTGHAVANVGNTFWQGVVNRNEDNNGSTPQLSNGQSKLTGELKTDVYHSSKRTNFSEGGTNADGKTRFNLDTAELYFDSQLNNMTSAHVALDYDGSNTLSEAFATMTHGMFYVKAGLQYLNFGSVMHDSIITPITQELTESDTTAVSLGAMNISGFYANVALFNGAAYGATGSDQLAEKQNNINGMQAELGYAMNQGMNPFYNYNGLNVYLDYMNDLADTNAISALKTAASAQFTEQHPGIAFHAGYATGPFQVYVDYVMSSKKFTEFKVDGSDADPYAYNVEADYSFRQRYIQTVTLNFGGSKDLPGLTDNAAYGPTVMPKTRMGVTYGIRLNKNVSLQAEYANEKDYGTGTTTTPAVTNTPTGNAANIFVGRLKVAF